MGKLDVGRLVPAALLKEGPSPGALQQLLDNVDRTAEQVRAGLFANMLAGVSGSADPKVLSAMITLHSISSASGTEQWVAQCANKYMEMQQHVAALQAELRAAQAAADLEATLREFRGFLENGQFSDAAYGLVQLRKILEDNTNRSSSPEKNKELMQLQQAYASCERDLDEAVESSLAEAFDCAPNAGVITISCSLPSGGDVGELWAAMEVANTVDKHLKGVADELLKHVLPYVLNGTAFLQSHIANGESAHLRWYPSTLQPDGKYPIEHVEHCCAQLLTVLAEALFRQRPATLAAFGRVFWEPFVQQYQAAFLQHVQGSTVAALQARQEAAHMLEQQAVAIGLAQLGTNLAKCLTHAIRQSYHVVQEGYLAMARELIVGHNPHAQPVVVGQPLPIDLAFYQRYKQGNVKAWEVLDPPSGWDVSGPVLATGYYHISNTVMQLVMMIDDALAYACHTGDTSMAQAIVGAVCKMAVMFNTMLPTPPASDAPALALQHHNDLQYLANHLLLVPFLFGPELRHLLGAPVWFGDIALQLRNAAKAALNDTLQVQGAAVHEAVLPMLELSATLAQGRTLPAKEAEPAMSGARQGALHTLRRAGRLLWSSLAPGVALEASQRLLDAVLGTLMSDVLGKRDVGEIEGSELVKLYRPLLDQAVPELLGDVDLTSQGPAVEGLDLKELVAVTLVQRSRELRKLGAVLSLLEARLAEIVQAWEVGTLRAAGLHLEEVQRLVKALFEDTDYRAQCLQRMEAAE